MSENARLCFSPHVRTTSARDECVIHNLENGRWLKVTQQILQLLRDFCQLGITGIQSALTDREICLTDFEELIGCLYEHGFLVEESSKNNEYSWYFPVAAYLNVTERCNLECKTCYFSAKKISTIKEMSTPECFTVMDRLASAGIKHLVVAGGEPLVRDDVIEILDYAHGQFEDITLITNGTLITPKLACKIVPFAHLFQISLDGPDEATNGQIRGEGSFDAAVRGIRLLKEAGAKNILIVCTVTKVNIGLLPEMAQLADSLGVELGSSVFLASGYGACNEKCLSPAWQDLLSDFREEIFQLTKEEQQTTESHYTETSNLRIGLSCGSGTQLISVAPDGSVYPCHVLHKSELVMGNLLETDGLLDLLEHSQVTQEFRKLDVDHKSTCRKCDVRYFCRGGCIAQALASSGKLDGKDRFCSLFKKVFRAQVWSINDHMTDREKANALLQALS